MRSKHQYRLILGVLSKSMIRIQTFGYKGLIADYKFWHGPCDVCKCRLKSAAANAGWHGGLKVRHPWVKQEDVHSDG